MAALVDVRFPEGSEGARHVARYHTWLGVGPAAAPMPRWRGGGAGRDVDLVNRIELVVLSVKDSAARCRLLGDDRTISLRSRRL